MLVSNLVGILKVCCSHELALDFALEERGEV